MQSTTCIISEEVINDILNQSISFSSEVSKLSLKEAKIFTTQVGKVLYKESNHISMFYHIVIHMLLFNMDTNKGENYYI